MGVIGPGFLDQVPTLGFIVQGFGLVPDVNLHFELPVIKLLVSASAENSGLFVGFMASDN